jgi:hypothetical protein
MDCPNSYLMIDAEQRVFSARENPQFLMPNEAGTMLFSPK